MGNKLNEFLCSCIAVAEFTGDGLGVTLVRGAKDVYSSLTYRASPEQEADRQKCFASMAQARAENMAQLGGTEDK